jgi:hypothetical protein
MRQHQVAGQGGGSGRARWCWWLLWCVLRGEGGGVGKLKCGRDPKMEQGTWRFSNPPIFMS